MAERKQGMNVYTVMIIIAAVNMAIAALLLYMELRSYGNFPWYKPDRGGGSSQVEAPWITYRA